MMNTTIRLLGKRFCLCFLLGCLAGCAAMPHVGPTRATVEQSGTSSEQSGLVVKKVDEKLARQLSEGKSSQPFSEIFGNAASNDDVIGPGDTLAITVWETPPSVLFGSITLASADGTLHSSAGALPAQMVGYDGKISIPFAGRIMVAGRSVQEIEDEIISRLQGKANNPQVMVRVSRNPSSQVAVIGDVTRSTNIPLTPKRECLLDALATAGGVSQPITKISLQLSRNGITASMPLDRIVRDPLQNVPLLPGDVLTVMFQPWTFTVLGGIRKNQEIPFEARGITLAQALARSGGLSDNTADPGGVFVFRFEEPHVVMPDQKVNKQLSAGDKIPVVYQVNFNDPAAFFITQKFPVQDKDVIYVANMPSRELEKFLRMVGMVLSPTLNIGRFIDR